MWQWDGSSEPELEQSACTEGQMPPEWALPSTGHLCAVLQVRRALVPHCPVFFSYVLSLTHRDVGPGSLSSPGALL